MGQTDAPEGPYTVQLLSEDLLALMKELKIEKVIILGHSMGSFIAQHFAASYCAYVEKLILCCSCSKPSPCLLDYLVKRQEYSDSNATSEELITDFGPLIFGNQFFTEERRLKLIEASKKVPFPQPKHGLKGQIEACLKHDASAILPFIKVPSLVISGEEDPLMTPQENEQLASRILGAKYYEMKGVSHMVFIENRSKFVELVIQFCLSKL